MTSFSTTLNEEFPHLKNKIYVDYAGAMVMCKSQIRVLAELTEGCHSNPHSSGQISQPVSDLEDLRSVICKTLGTTPGKYAVVFTQNASHANIQKNGFQSFKKKVVLLFMILQQQQLQIYQIKTLILLYYHC